MKRSRCVCAIRKAIALSAEARFFVELDKVAETSDKRISDLRERCVGDVKRLSLCTVLPHVLRRKSAVRMPITSARGPKIKPSENFVALSWCLFARTHQNLPCFLHVCTSSPLAKDLFCTQGRNFLCDC